MFTKNPKIHCFRANTIVRALAAVVVTLGMINSDGVASAFEPQARNVRYQPFLEDLSLFNKSNESTRNAAIRFADKPDEPDLFKLRITSRSRDPNNLRFVQSLSADTGIALYLETARLIDERHIRPTSYELRTQHALRNLIQAVDNSAFLQANQVSPARESVDAFKQRISRVLNGDFVKDSADALNVLRWTVSLARGQLNLSPGAVISEFIYGATESLDKYSRFVPPTRAGDSRVQLGDHVVGIGVSIELHDLGARIVKVLSGGPAAESGLRPGDLIRYIEGRSLEGNTLDQIVDKITGPTNSSVSMVVQRQAGDSFQIELLRRYIPIKSVTDVKILDDDSKIGYFKFDKFMRTSTAEVDRALWSLHRQGMKSLILDVRGNPGGLLTTAIEVSNKFLPCGSILSTRGRTAHDDSNQSATFTRTWKVPLVVLVDGNSASASEILAAAIQENGRGIIVGQRSYGKGTVQTQFPLETLNAGLRLTTAKFYSPRGRAMAGAGVEPDVVVDHTELPNAKNTLIDPVITAAVTVAKGHRVKELAVAKNGCGRRRGELYLIPS